ncbi:MAG TPA: acyl-CoA dehydrogenase family protein [Burkholderiaceae bacterium]|nr:acyl-CoA dehydrogenase family protein [Burkholderiaceae bacterium]
MDFQHSEDRRMLADTLDRFLRDKYNFDARQRIAQSTAGFSRDMWQRLAELGALAALFDEAHGGMGGTGFDIMVVFEAIGRALVVEPLAGALMAGQILAATGRGDALVQLIGGTSIILLAYEEGDTGADSTRIAAHAARDGNGWKLSGNKAAVHQAESADAFVVAARIAGAPGDVNGILLFLVPADAQGVKLRGYPLIDGGRGAEVMLTDVRLAADALLTHDGHPVLQQAIDSGLLALAAESLGAMEAVKAATLDYLQTRKQFGVPIGSFQALQHRMADLLLEIEQARSAVINAADKLAADSLLRERTLAAAKYTIGRVGTLVAEESIQLHGGIGMTWELPLAHYAKRLVMIDHQLGDEDQHLMRYIALCRERVS